MLQIIQGTALKVYADFADPDTGEPVEYDEVIVTVSRNGRDPRIMRLSLDEVARDDATGQFYCFVDTIACPDGHWDFQFAAVDGDQSAVARGRFAIRRSLVTIFTEDSPAGALVLEGILASELYGYGESVPGFAPFSGTVTSAHGHGDLPTGAAVFAGSVVDELIEQTITGDQPFGMATFSGSVVEANIAPPINTITPSIAYDNAVPGATFTGAHGTWTQSTGGGSLTYAYQWLRCDPDGTNAADISGETTSTYIATEDDIDHTIRVEVTATDSIGSRVATSTESDLVHFASQNIFIDPFLGSAGQVNWSTFSQNATFFFGGAHASTTSQNSEVTYEFYAEAGVYTLDLLLVNSTNRGVYTLFVDGVEMETQIDGYATAQVLTRGTVANVQILSTATHTLRLLMATKNPSSSGYEGAVSAITLTRAGELQA